MFLPSPSAFLRLLVPAVSVVADVSVLELKRRTNFMSDPIRKRLLDYKNFGHGFRRLELGRLGDTHLE